MTSSTSSSFEGCDLAALGSREIVVLSGCWREDRVRMVHRADGKVDLTLACPLDICSCAKAITKSLSSETTAPPDPASR
jgi:hypothetical protein